jgi:hypothetical protein
MTPDALPLEVPTAPVRGATSRALVVVGEGCPACGAALVSVEAVEEPLLRGCGYGSARRTVTRLCVVEGCRWWLTAEVGEVRPG